MNPLETIRDRWLFVQAGVGAPAASQAVVADVVERIDRTAARIIDRQTADGNPYGRPLSRAEFTFGTDVFAQIEKLASAWRCPFSRYFQQPAIHERIVAGLRFGEPFVRPDQPRDGSWHSWDIAFPTKLCSILLLCGDQLPAELREAILADLDFMPAKIFALDRLRGITKPALTSGSNHMSILNLALTRAVIQGDPQWLDSVLPQIPVVMGRASGSEGLQPDWSYQFHGHGVNAGYGTNDLWVQGHWIYLTQGTPWEVPATVRELFVGMVREFFARNMWRGRIAPYTIDRGIATPGTIYGGHAGALFGATLFGLLAGLPPQDETVFAAAAADFLSGLDPTGQPRKPAGNFLLTRVPQPIPANLNLLAGIRYYPCSEYLLARQADWFAAVRLSSGRTKMWNSMLGYNIHASSMAEFSIAFMTDGREFDHTTIPTMNWKRLMGVTRCDAIEPPPESYGQSAFCGGLAGDELGLLGLQYLLAPAGQDTLRANKSLFITPTALILLGSQIRCDSSEPVVTTLFHSPLRDENLSSRTLQAGTTLRIRNVSIQLLCDAQLIVETRRGSYADLNMPQVWQGEADKPGFHTVHEHRWVYLVVNHGIRPKNARYGAIITIGQPTECKILHEDNHHRVDVGQIGGEVRFPGDWRKPIGCSYWGAEQHQWGSIARWTSATELEITAPRRFVRSEQASTEILLPSGFAQESVTLKTYEGRPFPANILSTSANGQVHKLRVRRAPVQ
ncbi:MAG: hypothetical protein PCFJNLEI_03831 [Verrucomicrobiae bacterium]|nr:hypothetical protein [Verrucomicrobiae bacterium]